MVKDTNSEGIEPGSGLKPVYNNKFSMAHTPSAQKMMGFNLAFG